MSLLQSFGLGAGSCPYHGYSCSGICLANNMAAQQQSITTTSVGAMMQQYHNAVTSKLQKIEEKEDEPDINRKLLLLIR
jgi:hypothetical protein